MKIGPKKEEDLQYLWDTIESASGVEVDMPDEVFKALAKLSGVEIFALAVWLQSYIRKCKE